MFGFLPLNRKELFVVALCWSHLIFYGCTIPGTELPEVTFDLLIHFDKVVHFIFFFVFFLLWSGVRSYTRLYGFILITITFLYGLFIEYYQFNFVDGRGFELADVFADGLGSTTALCLRPFIAPYIIKSIDNS
jgi:VanZ family protein